MPGGPASEGAEELVLRFGRLRVTVAQDPEAEPWEVVNDPPATSGAAAPPALGPAPSTRRR